MSKSELKKELLSYIENAEDEELLSLLKEDIAFYGKAKDTDAADGLGEEQSKELKKLSEEDEIKDTDSLDEFKKATHQWRIK